MKIFYTVFNAKNILSAPEYQADRSTTNIWKSTNKNVNLELDPQLPVILIPTQKQLKQYQQSN